MMKCTSFESTFESDFMLSPLSSPQATRNVMRAAKSATLTAFMMLRVVFDNDKGYSIKSVKKFP